MTENIQSSEKEVSIVIYDSPLPPRYLKISRKLLKLLLVVLPIFFGLVFLSSISYLIYPHILKSPAPSLPKMLSSEEKKIRELEKMNLDLSESNKVLQTKLTQNDPATGAEANYLVGIKRPYGMRDLTEVKRIDIENIDLKSSSNKTQFSFQIVSNDPSRRISGNIFVYLIHSDGIYAYPNQITKNFSQGIKFTEGEPFAMSRLRPTTAEFNVNLLNETVRFVIYIFNREGDLLYSNESDLIKVTASKE